jgi:repressor LexA
MDKKDKIYKYIKSEIAKRGVPPTIREIGLQFDISSTNGVRYFLDKLEEEGLIRRQSRTARGIKIIEEGWIDTGRAVPLLGRVPAGKPSFSEEYIEDTIMVDKRMAEGDGVFAVRVSGDSMIGAGINDGDIAIVKQNPSPQNGEIVVALIADEVTLKRFLKRGKKIVLKPENDQYPEIDLTSFEDERIRILGSVSAIVRRYS